MDFVLGCWCENMQHADKNINLQVRKEADYYGDMIILPFIDRYDIVVLKTVAICEFGVCFSLLKS
jgi:hypothetical protein